MQIHVYKNADEVCDALAAWITDLIDKTLLAKENFTWALSGGETPKKLILVCPQIPALFV
jgi:6-phosphogluconolactonase